MLAVRNTVRVLLLDPAQRLLLMAYRNLDDPTAPVVWATAGGEIEVGETIEQAALREIAEETGQRDVRLGPRVWYGEWTRPGRPPVRFKETFIVAQAAGDALSFDGWTDHERRQIADARWWTLPQIAASAQTIYPIGLADLLPPILRGQYPARLIDLPEG